MLKLAVQFARSFARDDRGATAIEYGLIVAIVGLGIIAGAILISDSLDVTFTDVSDGFAAALG